MLKIRLMRIGGKKKPFYRVVAVDERAKRTGAYLELLGTYNPLTEPKDIQLKKMRIDYWIKQGAQLSNGYLRIIGKAPPRPPRKPKKEKKTEEPAAISDQTSEKKVQEEKPIEKIAGEEAKSDEVVSVNSAKQSSQDEDQTQIATEPVAPRDDKVEESEKKDERSA